MRKKNRGFVRQLNRELNALRSDNNYLRGILDNRIMRTDDIALQGFRLSVTVFDVSNIVT